MSCNAVAKLTARVAVDLSALREPNPAVLALVQKALVPIFGRAAESAWPIDYRYYYPDSHPSAGAYEYYVAGISIDVYPDRIQIGANSRAQAAELSAKITPIAQALAGLIQQGKIRQAIAARARITSETRTPAGAIILNLEL